MKPDRIHSSEVNTQSFVNVWDVDVEQSVITPKVGYTLDVSGVSSIDWDDITGLTFSNNDTLQYISGALAARTPAQVRATLSLVPGTDVQAYDADLATIAGLTATTDNFIVSVASAWASRTPAQVKTTLSLNLVENTALSTWTGSTNLTTLGTITTGTWNGTDVAVTAGGTGASTAADARTNLGLVIGTNVQAWDADLDTIAALDKTKGNIITATGSAWGVTTIGSDGKVPVANSNSTNGWDWFDIQASPTVRYISGRYYAMTWSGDVVTQGTVSTSTTYFFPIVVGKRSTWTGIAFSAHTFSANGKMALFDDTNNGEPGAVVGGTTGTITSAVTGNNLVTWGSPVTLNPGVYFGAVIFSSTSGSLNCAEDYSGLQGFFGSTDLNDNAGHAPSLRSTTYTYAGGFSSSNPTVVYTVSSWTPLVALRAQ